MIERYRPRKAAIAAAAFTLLAGTPVLADDVELLLSNAGANAQPNILFILDTSGSMQTIERTQEPYNGAKTYAGDCPADRIYWTDSDEPPECDDDDWVSAENFVCATGNAAIAESGVYSDTMAMYRGKKPSEYKWQRLKGDRDRLVECKDDSGLHGNGDPAQVYAMIGTGVPPFTDNPFSEVAWGSSPTEEVITAYSGNYLNWYYNSPIVEMSRIDIVKSVTKNVLDSINNANVGLMRFNWDQGGSVIHAVKDLDSNRTQVASRIDGLPANGWTPLSETMYEAALYWRGAAPRYGTNITDTDAYTTHYSGGSVSGYSYNEPATLACAKNFNVLLTDGEPTQDVDAWNRVGSLPGWSDEIGSSNCKGGNEDGSCLDDIAKYLHEVDINPSVEGDQTVTTYTIGFTVDLDILEDTAKEGGGEYYLASDTASLTKALTEIITNIFDRDISFTVPAVSVNAFNRTQNLNDLYISVFRAKNKMHWPGNLKKYRIQGGQVVDKNGNNAVDPDTGFFADSAHSFWTEGTKPDGAAVSAGGAAAQLPDPADRLVYTNLNGNSLTAASNAISPSNAAAFTHETFGLNGTQNDPSVYDMIQWIRGVDVADVDNDPNTMVRRDMGDTLHSQPAAIMYSANSGTPEVVVYTATNDGYLHAIDGTTGRELWSFIPQEMLGELGDLFHDTTVNYKHYGIDGDIVPVVADRNKNGTIEPGTDFVYLIFGMRRGGDFYYALDVTNKNSPQVKWVRSYTNMGQSWSPASLARMELPGVNSDKAVLVFGGGYDTVHDQAAWPELADGEAAGIHIVDLHTGDELWRAGRDTGADLVDSRMTRAIPSRVRVLDLSGDGIADRMYAIDIGGQVWRFDVGNGAGAGPQITGGVIARLGQEGNGGPDDVRFYAAPDIAIFYDEALSRRFLSVSVGSGYRSHPLDNKPKDHFFSLRDPDVFRSLTQTEYDTYLVVEADDLVDVQGELSVEIGAGDRGWKLELPKGQKVFSESQTFDNAVYFVSFEPQLNTDDPCLAGTSINRLYKVDIRNGNPVVDLSTLDPDDKEAIDESRVTELEQGGIAPKPSFLFPSPDDPDCEGSECATPPIGCVGVECFDPGFNNRPVRTLWTQSDTN